MVVTVFENFDYELMKSFVFSGKSHRVVTVLVIWFHHRLVDMGIYRLITGWPMSRMAIYTPRMEMSRGSRGQGLTIAVGMGLGLRLKGNSAFVYNSMSDGELDEGATWEAAMSAAHHK